MVVSRSSEALLDPLSVVLSIVRPRSYGAGALTLGGRWSYAFGEHPGVKCYAVAKGSCWFELEDAPHAVPLGAGDGLLLPHGRPFRLCSALDVPPVDARALLAGSGFNDIRRVDDDPDAVVILGGHFALEGDAKLLLDALPSFVHLDREADKLALRTAVERIGDEMREPRPGGSILAQQSAMTMLVLALRLYLDGGAQGGVGWLAALADPQLASAVAAMHHAPANAWTVQSLAETVGMSRTSFAERFRQTVGEAPMEYLTRWRMRVAGDRLRSSSDSIATIARAVGYESESAFCSAFKRTMGASPREHSRARG